MKIMCNKTPDCVVDPLACWDVEHNGQKAKLLVTEWSKADEQFGNQFADGSVDPRMGQVKLVLSWTVGLHFKSEWSTKDNRDFLW